MPMEQLHGFWDIKAAPLIFIMVEDGFSCISMKVSTKTRSDRYQYAYSFHNIGTTPEWILIITMIAGRLEIFTLLFLFIPGVWWGNAKQALT